MSQIDKNLVPELRFPQFLNPWREDRIDSFVKRVRRPVEVELEETYREIGVRSHGKGIFHKPPVTGSDLGNKRVFWVHPNAFVVNIVFGWEQAVALTTQHEKGFIASHRFPMFVPLKDKIELRFMLLFFLRKRGKHLLELASPGGAGRNKTLGQNEFAKLKIIVPNVEEQRKIADFLGAVDTKLNTLRRKRGLLSEYKRGVMQKIFSREIRFVGDDRRPFAEWEDRAVGEMLLDNRLGGNYPNSETKTEAPLIKMGNLGRGYIDLGKMYFIEDGIEIDEEDRIKQGDLFFNTRNTLDLVGKVAIWRGELEKAFYNSNLMRLTFENNHFMNHLFNSYIGLKKLRRLATGTTSVAAIYTRDLMKVRFFVPELREQHKIAAFLTAVDKKLTAVDQQIEQMEMFKKGLLQQMFV